MKKEKEGGRFLSLLIRYSILVVITFPNLWIFYKIFTPLTIYGVYYLLGFFFDVSLMKSIIVVGNIPIEIIGACVAGAAYYLLLIFNLSTPKIKVGKRLKMLFLAFIIFYILNVLRIFSLVFLLDSPWFDVTHKLFWYFGSVILVIGIWFFEVIYFRIKEIPFYSDLKFLYKHSIIKK